MQLILSDKELETVIMDGLCNAVGTGWMAGYGLRVDLKATNYNKYREEGDCFEDVLMKALKAGEAFHMVDKECDGEYNASFTLEEARERLKNERAANDIMTILNENGDAVTSDCIMQWCLYEEVIFG